MDREGNLHSKFEQVLHLDAAGVWAGKHVDASRGSLRSQAGLRVEQPDALVPQAQCGLRTPLPPPAKPGGPGLPPRLPPEVTAIPLEMPVPARQARRDRGA